MVLIQRRMLWEVGPGLGGSSQTPKGDIIIRIQIWWNFKLKMIERLLKKEKASSLFTMQPSCVGAVTSID